MPSYKIFTVNSGSITTGATVGKFALQGADKTIPAILVGETGRGRQLGVLPVELTSTQFAEWESNGKVEIKFAEPGVSKSGKPKLFAKEVATDTDKFIGVFRTKIGFRGSNAHTGDRTGYTVPHSYSSHGPYWAQEAIRAQGETLPSVFTLEEAVQWIRTNAPDAASANSDVIDVFKAQFAPFPGEILSKGQIAQGDAGGMGSGDQLVAVIPINVWFRTNYSGRLYGAPGAHYYKWTGSKLISVTWDERQMLDESVDETPEPENVPTIAPASTLPALPASALAIEKADEEPESAPIQPSTPAVQPVVESKPAVATITITEDLLRRLMAGCSNLDTVFEAREALQKNSTK